MGITYEGALAVADLKSMSAALARIGEPGLVVPIAEHRVAVLPTETYGGIAEIDEYAADISRAGACSVLAHGVYDSDVLILWVYRKGALLHKYVSDVGTQGTVFEDRDGVMKIELDGETYLESDPNRPHGPVGVSAAPFQPFALGESSADLVCAALADGRFHGDARGRHAAFLRALNIESPVLHTTHDRVGASDLQDSVLIERQ